MPRFSVDFTSEPATSDGATGGDAPPFLSGYDVANTDFLTELNVDAKAEDDKFTTVSECKNPKAVSILLRGGTEHVVDELERALHDALSVVGITSPLAERGLRRALRVTPLSTTPITSGCTSGICEPNSRMIATTHG